MIFINYLLIPIFLASFLYRRFAWFISGLASLAVFWLCSLEGRRFDSLIPLAAFNVTPYIIFQFRKMKDESARQFASVLAQAEERYSKLTAADARVEDFNGQLDKRVLETANLYEITKEMSSSLSFKEILDILSRSLRRSFIFRRCHLITLKDAKEGLAIERVYEIASTEIEAAEASRPEEGAGLVREVPPGQNDIEALKIFLKSRRPLVLTNTDEGHDTMRLAPLLTSRDRGSVTGQGAISGCDSFLAQPLQIEDGLSGILTVEDMAPRDFERFFILAGQFQLELKKVRLYEKIAELAITDGLTSTYLRRHFLQRSEEELRRSLKYDLRLSFLMVDVDYFKGINDTYGHLVGDVVLREVASLMKANIREIDLLGRYGGEEFVIVLPETDKKDAGLVAERIREAVSEHEFRVYDERLRTTVSLGLAGYPYDGRAVEEIIEAADAALYNAKREGRNRVCVK